MTYPKILHHGATDGVTGSCHELVVDEKNSLLIDCGLFQGNEAPSSSIDGYGRQIEFDSSRVKALLITHCHIDHVGRIPYLLAAGFDGPIYASEPTATLLPLVLEDALKIGFTKDAHLIRRFLDKIDSQLRPTPYRKWVSIPTARTKIRFSPAGHILGSSFIECQTVNGKRVLFSGDLGAPYTPLLPSPKAPYGTDILVLESTYGDKLHEDRKLRKEKLKKVVERCFANRGVILIPAFSIGRTQELLYELEQVVHRFPKDALSNGMVWEDVEVIVDSPLANRFTEVYRELKSYWDQEAKRTLRQGRHPLSFEQSFTVDSHQQHQKIVDYLKQSARPAIVIAAGGMCSGGRIVAYLTALLGDPRTDVLFVGYQAAGTPGRIIQQYGPKGGYVNLEGKRIRIKAGIHTISGYSAHADQTNLVNFVKRMRQTPGEIRLVHGDSDAKAALSEKLQRLFPLSRVSIGKGEKGVKSSVGFY